MAPPRDRPPKADIDTSPALLIASLFAARRSGDALLARVYARRLADIGIRILDEPLGGTGCVDVVNPGTCGAEAPSAEVPT